MTRARRLFLRYGLTVGELGASTGQSALIALLPVLLREHTSSTFLIGLAMAGEGIFALFVPIVVGFASDRLPASLAQRFGRRTLFLMLAAPVMAAGLALAPFLDSYWGLVVAALAFFAGLHGYQTPLWALMVDAVPSQGRSRVQGARGLLRSLGLALGFVGGGMLHAVSPALPFLAAAALVLLTTAVTVAAGRKAAAVVGSFRAERRAVRDVARELRSNPPAMWFIAANACWSGAIDGVRPFFNLFAITVLGLSIGEASIGLLLLVLGLGAGALAIGHLGDRLERVRLLQAGVLTAFVAMALAFFARNLPMALVVVPLAGIGSSAIVALAYPVFADLVGGRNMGQYTGLYIFSVGFGRILAPMLVGLVIDAGKRFLPGQGGYPFMWLFAAVLAAAAYAALHRSIRVGAALRSARSDAA